MTQAFHAMTSYKQNEAKWSKLQVLATLFSSSKILVKLSPISIVTEFMMSSMYNDSAFHSMTSYKQNEAKWSKLQVLATLFSSSKILVKLSPISIVTEFMMSSMYNDSSLSCHDVIQAE